MAIEQGLEKEERLVDESGQEPDGDVSDASILPTVDEGPEADYTRFALLDTLQEALDELPDVQREIFIAPELEGTSFKELSRISGVRINTLLARKRYAVLYLRSRLRATYDKLEI